MTIRRIKMRSGYAAELENLKDRIFEFTPGLNVLFGPNGCGKSTLLKVMAGHTGINTSKTGASSRQGGWSGPPKSWRTESKKFPTHFKDTTVGNCEANMRWDGMPVFLNSASLSDTPTMTHFMHNVDDSPDGMTDIGEQIGMMNAKISEGQMRMHKLAKVIARIRDPKKRPPPYTEMKSNDNVTEAAYVDYIMKQSRDGAHTLLWDEPDRSIALPYQMRFLTNVLKDLVEEGLQIIMATHSIFPILHQDADWINIVDVQEGYVTECQCSLLAAIGCNEKLTRLLTKVFLPKEKVE